MELGQLLKQARLEAGLSQRQLCGDEITRNMLSQIENGAARPSMDTLRYLAGKLGKPVGYFLQEDIPSPNQQLLLSARQAYAQGRFPEAMTLLEQFQSPDEIFDAERHLLQALVCLSLAQQALEKDRIPYCLSLLEKAAAHCKNTPYGSEDLTHRILLVQAKAEPVRRREILGSLPNDGQWLLVAQTLLAEGDPQACAGLLALFPQPDDPQWHLLQGDAAMAQGNYQAALDYYLPIEDQALAQLERCYEQLEDYKMAYHYACKQRAKK